jgi:hypothetical protein
MAIDRGLYPRELDASDLEHRADAKCRPCPALTPGTMTDGHTRRVALSPIAERSANAASLVNLTHARLLAISSRAAQSAHELRSVLSSLPPPHPSSARSAPAGGALPQASRSAPRGRMVPPSAIGRRRGRGQPVGSAGGNSPRGQRAGGERRAVPICAATAGSGRVAPHRDACGATAVKHETQGFVHFSGRRVLGRMLASNGGGLVSM